MSELNRLSLSAVESALSGQATAFRMRMDYEPAGGKGDKIFPSTYEGGKYALEKRVLPNESGPVDCVLLDSVQSQANRMELALLQAWRKNAVPLPVITVDFNGTGLDKVLRITSLEAPHRIVDAIIRDSLIDDVPFRKSSLGKALDNTDSSNATFLFSSCPTALVFGAWDSTSSRGVMGFKFARAIASEIIGTHVIVGVKTSSRNDPAQIQKEAGPLYEAANGGWTLNPKEAKMDGKNPKKLGKDGKPSEVVHGNITPSISDGGVTVREIKQITVVSLPALRRLSFPLDGSISPEVDLKARVVLATLALCGATLAADQGCDLRSRCFLRPVDTPVWEILGSVKEEPKRFILTSEDAMALYKEAVSAAKAVGLPFNEEELVLKPAPQLVELVRRSQELASSTASKEEDGA